MRLLFTALAFLISVSMIGQGWEQTYGGASTENARSVQQTTDGGYIIAGLTSSFGAGERDVYLIKTDGSGIEQWSQTFGGIDYDYGYSVQQTTDGGYIIVGATYSFAIDPKVPGNLSDIYLIKTDANGIEEWSQTYGGTGNDVGTEVQETSNGGYIIIGTTIPDPDMIGAGPSDVFLIKTYSNGIEEWSHTYGGDLGDEGNSVQQTSDGGFIISGQTLSFGTNGNHDAYLIKTNENGEEQWSQTYYGEIYTMRGESVKQTTDGGYIIVGDRGGENGALLKMDENGQLEWSQQLEGRCNEIQQTSDGGYIIVGDKRIIIIDSPPTYKYHLDVFLIKTDDNGEEQWSQTFGGEWSDSGYSVQETTDGGFVIAGSTQVEEGIYGANVYLIKTDSEGTLSSSFTIPTPTPRKLDKVVDALGREVNQTTNQILFHIYDDGSVEKKFVVE